MGSTAYFVDLSLNNISTCAVILSYAVSVYIAYVEILSQCSIAISIVSKLNKCATNYSNIHSFYFKCGKVHHLSTTNYIYNHIMMNYMMILCLTRWSCKLVSCYCIDNKYPYFIYGYLQVAAPGHSEISKRSK